MPTPRRMSSQPRRLPSGGLEISIHPAGTLRSNAHMAQKNSSDVFKKKHITFINIFSTVQRFPSPHLCF